MIVMVLKSEAAAEDQDSKKTLLHIFILVLHEHFATCTKQLSSIDKRHPTKNILSKKFRIHTVYSQVGTDHIIKMKPLKIRILNILCNLKLQFYCFV